jgi:uncharacterized protein involved in exopolysaccharide biosynthesis/Mrp family chromosome partitioning ATPase
MIAHPPALPDTSTPPIVYEPQTDAAEAQLGTIVRAVGARWRLVAAFVLGGVALMGLVTLLMDRRWSATALIHVENEMPRVTKIDQVVSGPGYLESVEYFQDQVNLLKSRTLSAEVIRELGLEKNERFWPRPPGIVGRIVGGAIGLLSRLGSSRDPAPPAAEPTPAGGPPVASAAVDRYLSNLDVKAIPNSRLIQVKASARDAGLAQAIANAHANEYIRRTLQAKFELTGAARKYLEQELARVRREADASEKALNDFRREARLVATEEQQGNAVVDRLSDLSRRLTRAQAERIALEAQHQLIQTRDYEALPGVLQNALIQTLKADLARLESREAELGRLFLSGHPELQQVQAQVRQQRSRLQKEVERVVGGVESQYAAAQATEQALRQEFDRQQDDVLDLRERSSQYVKLDQAVQANRQLYSALLQRMGETDVVRGVQLSNITVLDPAERPREPAEPRTILNLLFGVVLGLVFGIGTAALLEHVDTSLKTPADVHRILALPTLGVIPDFRRIGTTERLVAAGAANRQLPATRGQALAAEVFRTLRTSLLFFDPAQPPRTMLVTSARAGEGKTATAVNLALSLAQLGAKVVLVDADLRKPRCHHALGVPGGPGLAEVLLGELDTLEAVRPASVRADARNGHAQPKAPNGPNGSLRQGATLAFMPSGRLIADAAELLASARMRIVLAALAGTYDIVLVDSPPVFPVADTSLLGRLVDGVVLVVHGSRTPRHVTQEAIGRLRFMQAKVIGVVLNGVDPGASEYSYRYSHYFPDAAEA